MCAYLCGVLPGDEPEGVGEEAERADEEVEAGEDAHHRHDVLEDAEELPGAVEVGPRDHGIVGKVDGPCLRGGLRFGVGNGRGGVGGGHDADAGAVAVRSAGF